MSRCRGRVASLGLIQGTLPPCNTACKSLVEWISDRPCLCYSLSGESFKGLDTKIAFTTETANYSSPGSNLASQSHGSTLTYMPHRCQRPLVVCSR